VAQDVRMMYVRVFCMRYSAVCVTCTTEDMFPQSHTSQHHIHPYCNDSHLLGLFAPRDSSVRLPCLHVFICCHLRPKL